MEVYVIVYLLLFLNDFSVGEKAESLAIRSQIKCQQPGVLINKLIPQQLNAVPNIVSKLNPPQLNLELDNRSNIVPELLITVANQQKNTLTPNATALKELKPSVIRNNNQEPGKEFKNPVPSQKCDIKNENPKENIQQVEDRKAKASQFFEEVDQNDINYLDTMIATLNKPFHENNVKNKIKTDMETDPNSSQKSKTNQEKSEYGNLSKMSPLVNLKDTKSIIEEVNKKTELPKNKTETQININLKPESGRRANNPDTIEIVPEVVDNNAKDTIIPITIYNFNDIISRYTKTRDSEPRVYAIETDQSTNQQANNVFIKNQNVEELCENSEDTYETSQPQYYCHEPAEANYYQNNFPNYQHGILQYNPKDRIWRNWKTTEIYMSKYEPEFKNKQYSKYNGFNTPFMYGDIAYNTYKNNKPLYQCYEYPTYKYIM